MLLVLLPVAIVSLLPQSLADIPVHCTQFQILGKWRFHVGTWKDGDPLCGGSHPDVADGHKDRTPPMRNASQKELGSYWLSDNFKEMFTMEVTLRDWRLEVDSISESGQRIFPGAPSSKPRGLWTMVYDEGFNMHIEDGEVDPNFHSLFAFSKYTLGKGDDSGSTDNVANKQHSHCGYTLVGWYKIHDKGSLSIKQNLCYWGERIEHLYPALLKKHEAQMPPQGLLVNARKFRANDHEVPDGIVPGPGGSDPRPNCPGGLCDDQGNSTSKVVDRHAARQRLHDISIGKYAMLTNRSLTDAASNGTVVRYQSDPEKIRNFAKCSSFNEPYREPSTVQELLNRWSPPPTLGFPALPGFSSEQIIGPVQMRALAEQEQVAKDHGYASPKQVTLEDMHEHWGAPVQNHHKTRTFFLDGQRLGPEEWRDRANFDWRDVSLVLGGGASDNTTVTGFVPPVPDQGNCGSCYAVGATSMLTARLMLRYPELYHQRFMDGDRVSWHQQLDCNHYVQGCDGGYPLLVSRWSMENDVVLKSCSNAVGRHGPNEECAYAAAECKDDRFRVRHFRYVGGSFGRCGSKRLCEAALREELYKGGPLTVSVEPTSDFSAFTGGILHRIQDFPSTQTEIPENANETQDCTQTECYTWRKIDHSMLLVGWGEDEKYGKYCSAKTGEELERADECKLHNDSEDDCKTAGCHYGGFPYWILQNSWTVNWGQDGYLLVGPRGQNPLMLEMMAVSADIVRASELGNSFVMADDVEERKTSMTAEASNVASLARHDLPEVVGSMDSPSFLERSRTRPVDSGSSVELPEKRKSRLVRVKHGEHPSNARQDTFAAQIMRSGAALLRAGGR